MQKLYLFVGAGFGSGYLPKMPGTWGSVVGLFIALGLAMLGKTALLYGTILSILLGWYCCHQVMMSYPPEQEDTDPSFLVIDEIAGILLTLLLVWWGSDILGIHLKGESAPISQNYSVLGLCFITFRFFDILKPYPIKNVEHSLSLKREHQGLGIMLDDLVAAFFAAVVTLALMLIF